LLGDIFRLAFYRAVFDGALQCDLTVVDVNLDVTGINVGVSCELFVDVLTDAVV